MRLIQNGIDVERFCSDRDAFNELPTILAAGRLSREKGFDILVEALHLLAGKQRYFKCLIAGDGPEKASLSALRDNLGLGDKIDFLGYVRDIAPLMKTCDLLVLPSRHEGLPLSLLEAMASGLPVVASAVGGIPDLLTPDKGWVVPPANPEVLADTIETVLDNPDQALKKAQRGRVEVANDYDIKKTANQYEDLYLDLCQHTGVVGRAPKGGLRG